MLNARSLFILVFILLTKAANGQDGPDLPVHTGKWFGVGLGAGHAYIDCSRCGRLTPDDPWNGGLGWSGFLVVGGTLQPDVLLGGELNVWANRNSEQRRDATLLQASLVVQYYPLPVELYIKAGVGVGAMILAGGPGRIEETGLGLQAGLGYDIRAGSRLAVAPYVNYVLLLAPSTEGENRGARVLGPAYPSVLEFGVGVIWY